MSASGIEQLADAVAYEGYNLYPYRPSALKNRHRWLFGCVLPRDWWECHANGESWFGQSQVLLVGGPQTLVEVRLRFLQPTAGIVGQACGPNDPNADVIETEEGTIVAFQTVDSLSVDGQLHQTWQEAEDRCVAESFRIDELLARSHEFPIASTPKRNGAELRTTSGVLAGVAIQERRPLAARMSVRCERLSQIADVFRLTVRVENRTEMPAVSTAKRDDALLHSLVSMHTILHTLDGEYVSSIDPPSRLCEAADGCRNIGVWPVLVGDARSPKTMLAAPIILEDFPQIAPESPGDLFDATEIDEVLSLRIQTMTDDEKREAASADERTRQLFERTESLERPALESLHADGCQLCELRTKFRAGDRVRIRPQRRGDAFDLILNGRAATISAVECDFEDNVHLVVTIDDDPGKDLGALGMPGHRFFFHPDEVEPIEEVRPSPRAATSGICSILVAGIGNIFKGDDGFGVEVIRTLLKPSGGDRWDLPPDVAVIDFGIRGVDLAFALTSGFERVIMVDAMPHGGEPGSVYVIQPDTESPATPLATVQGHNLDPHSVIQWARGICETLPEITIVGCEPAMIPDEEELVEGLTPPVRAAVGEAVDLIRNLISQFSRTAAVV